MEEAASHETIWRMAKNADPIPDSLFDATQLVYLVQQRKRELWKRLKVQLASSGSVSVR